jgi:hypothetical protein
VILKVFNHQKWGKGSKNWQISLLGLQCASQATKQTKKREEIMLLKQTYHICQMCERMYIYIYIEREREREITMVPNAVGGFDVIFVPLRLFPRWNGHYQAYSIMHNGSWSVSPNPSPMCPNTPGLYTHNGSIDGFKRIYYWFLLFNTPWIKFVVPIHEHIGQCHIRPKTQPKMSATL